VADAFFLCDKSVVIREKMKQTLYEYILTVTANINIMVHTRGIEVKLGLLILQV
jgi:hypothetical protein